MEYGDDDDDDDDDHKDSSGIFGREVQDKHGQVASQNPKIQSRMRPTPEKYNLLHKNRLSKRHITKKLTKHD